MARSCQVGRDAPGGFRALERVLLLRPPRGTETQPLGGTSGSRERGMLALSHPQHLVLEARAWLWGDGRSPPPHQQGLERSLKLTATANWAKGKPPVLEKTCWLPAQN